MMPQKKPTSTYTTVDMTSDGEALRASLPRDEKGDPTLSPELQKALVMLLQEGNTLKNSAKVCGLRLKILKEWLDVGRQDVEDGKVSVEGNLARACDAAQGDQERRLSKIVFDKAKSDPRLALDTLGRRSADDWAPAIPEPQNLTEIYGRMDLATAVAEVRRLTESKEPQK